MLNRRQGASHLCHPPPPPSALPLHHPPPHPCFFVLTLCHPPPSLSPSSSWAPNFPFHVLSLHSKELPLAALCSHCMLGEMRATLIPLHFGE